jgi:chromosome partitioning protein
LRKISIINQKGGVGKTTVTLNIAAGLARAGKRVLIVDCDPQGNIETCLPINDDTSTLCDLIMEQAELSDCIAKVAVNLDVITSGPLHKAELYLAECENREYVVSRVLDDIEGYDYVLLDCPPSMGLLTQNVLLYAEEAYVPVSTDILGVDALQKVAKSIESLNERFGHSLLITKVIPTMYDQRNRICVECLKQVQNEFYEIVSKPIRVNAKLKECAKVKRSIFSYDNSSRGAEDFRELVKQVLYDEGSDAKMAVDIKEGRVVARAK